MANALYMIDCECYDTLSDSWFKIDSLPPLNAVLLYSTTFDNKFVYVAPLMKQTHQMLFRLDASAIDLKLDSKRIHSAIAS